MKLIFLLIFLNGVLVTILDIIPIGLEGTVIVYWLQSVSSEVSLK